MLKTAFWSGFTKRFGLGLNRLPQPVAHELQKQNVREGLGLFAQPVLAVTKRLGKSKSVRHAGKKKTFDFIKNVQKPFLDVDTELGHHLSKIPGVGNLFKQEESLRAGKDLTRKYLRPSATAPLHKATEIAKPIVFGGAVAKAVEKLKKNKEQENHG